jgi:hypothetical protein
MRSGKIGEAMLVKRGEHRFSLKFERCYYCGVTAAELVELGDAGCKQEKESKP